MSRVGLSPDGCLGLRQCFAGLDALVPCVIKLGVTRTSAVSEPITTAAAATSFPRFRDDAAFGAYGTDSRCRGCWCVYVGIGQNKTQRWKHKNSHCLIGMRENLSTWCQSGTYFCRPRRLQTTCDQRFYCRHPRNSCTKHHQGRNNWLSPIS